MDTVKPHPLGFVINADGTLSGPLKAGIDIAGQVHRDFVLRPALVDDLLEAELEADVTRPLAFNAALLVRQLVSVGSYTGPFSTGLVRRMRPVDWRRLRAAQDYLDQAGEPVPGSGQES